MSAKNASVSDSVEQECLSCRPSNDGANAVWNGGQSMLRPILRALLGTLILFCTLMLFSGSSHGTIRQDKDMPANNPGDVSACFDVQGTSMHPAQDGWLLDVELRVIQPQLVTGTEFDTTWTIGGAAPRVISVTQAISYSASLFMDVDHSFMVAQDTPTAIAEGAFWTQRLFAQVIAPFLLTSNPVGSADGIKVFCNCACGATSKSCEPLPSDSAAGKVQSALQCIRRDPTAGALNGNAIDVCGASLPGSTVMVVVRGQPHDSLLFDEELRPSELAELATDMINRYTIPNIPIESTVVILILGRSQELSTTDELEKQSLLINSSVLGLAKDHKMSAFLVPMTGDSVDKMIQMVKSELSRPSLLRMRILLPKLLTESQAQQANILITHKGSNCPSVPISIPTDSSGEKVRLQASFLKVLRLFPQAVLYFLVPLIALTVGLFTYRFDLLSARTNLNDVFDFPWLPKK